MTTTVGFALSSLPLLCCCCSCSSTSAPCSFRAYASYSGDYDQQQCSGGSIFYYTTINGERHETPQLPSGMDPTGEGGVVRQADEPLQSGVAGSTGGESTSATLNAEEFESWTLLDSSPKRSSQPGAPMDSKEKREPEKDSTSDEAEEDAVIDEEDAEDEEEDDVDDEEDESEKEVEVAEGAEQVDSSEKPSGVEPVKEKLEDIKRDEDARDGGVAAEKESQKNRANSERSIGSNDGCSSDGISVISESEGGDQPKLHINKEVILDKTSSKTQLTSFLPPEREDSANQTSPRRNQLKRKRSRSDVDQALVPNDGMVPWKDVNRTSVVLLGVVITAVAAVLVGNSRLYQHQIGETDFQHEQRISELELENNILKNEMNKLKHLYTRNELEDQVQQAEFEWKETMEEQGQTEPEPEPEPLTSAKEEPETPQVRKVPPQDDNIKRRVVWSGDDGEPMLVADKDYVLPEFCYNKNAVQDSLFSEYSAKYCDIRKRKIEARQRKAEYAKQHKKYKEPKDYKQYIHPTAEEVAEHQRQARIPPAKAPSLSPFDFDFNQAYESIKEEGAVIVDSLVAILDLDPEPEWVTKSMDSSSQLDQDSNNGYIADDEASSTTVGDSTSTDSVQPKKSQPKDEINWVNYPTWVREKYENKPEMHQKLKNKALLLWDWENKKNQFLHEVGLTTLEEVEWKTEDELQQKRQQYKKERGDYRDYEYKKHDDRKGKGKYDERKQWKDHPRNGNERTTDHKDNHKDNKEWKGDKTRHISKERKDDNKQWEQNRSKDTHDNRSRNGESPLSEDGSYLKQYREEDKHHEKDSKEPSSERDGKHYKKEWNESSGEREYKNKNRKQEYRKNGNSERSSGDGKNRELKDHTKTGEQKKFEDSRKPGEDGKHRKRDEFSGDARNKEWKDYNKNRNRKEWEDSREMSHNGDEHKTNSRTEFSGDGKTKEWKEHKKNGENRDDARKNGSNGNKHNHHESDEQSSGEGAYLSQYREDSKKQYKQKEEYKQKYNERQQHHNRRGDDDDDDDDDHYKHRDHRGSDDHYRKSQKDSQDKRHTGNAEHWDKQREEKKWHDREQKHHSQDRRR